MKILYTTIVDGFIYQLCSDGQLFERFLFYRRRESDIQLGIVEYLQGNGQFRLNAFYFETLTEIILSFKLLL